MIDRYLLIADGFEELWSEGLTLSACCHYHPDSFLTAANAKGPGAGAIHENQPGVRSCNQISKFESQQPADDHTRVFDCLTPFLLKRNLAVYTPANVAVLIWTPIASTDSDLC